MSEQTGVNDNGSAVSTANAANVTGGTANVTGGTSQNGANTANVTGGTAQNGANAANVGTAQNGANAANVGTAQNGANVAANVAQASEKIPRRVLGGLLSALAAGVVPRSGAPYIAIGRADEIGAMLSDLEQISEGGSAMRFLIGRYGSGKSFLIQLIRGFALERGFLCADADLSPERRFSGGNGTGIATYRELVKNLACRTSPDGGALPVVVSRWLEGLQSELIMQGFEGGSDAMTAELGKKIHAVARSLESEVGGFDFATVLNLYYRAHIDGDDAKMSACLRWLRGEFGTKSEARETLGVKIGSVVDDENWYDYVKLMAAFSRRIGYRGLVVFVDECVNLYKIANRISRENNYEKILAMFNDTLQGRAEGLMLVLGGTPQFFEDPRRGLYSYEALRSRLTDGRFGGTGGVEFRNMLSPVIRLRRLSDDELLALIVRLTRLHGQYYAWDAAARITDGDRVAFLQLCLSRAGASMMVTPREIIRDYMTVCNILCQNPDASFSAVCGTITPTASGDSDSEVEGGGDTGGITGAAKSGGITGAAKSGGITGAVKSGGISGGAVGQTKGAHSPSGNPPASEPPLTETPAGKTPASDSAPENYTSETVKAPKDYSLDDIEF